MEENLILCLIKAHWAQIHARIFFKKKIWLRQSLDIMVSYHHVKYQKKLMIQSWENLDRWTDRQTEGQTEKGES